MQITGSNSFIKFDLENGYILKADGEMLIDRKFVVYIDSMKFWEPPYDDEKVTKEQITDIMERVKRNMNENTVQIIFE